MLHPVSLLVLGFKRAAPDLCGELGMLTCRVNNSNKPGGCLLLLLFTDEFMTKGNKLFIQDILILVCRPACRCEYVEKHKTEILLKHSSH